MRNILKAYEISIFKFYKYSVCTSTGSADCVVAGVQASQQCTDKEWTFIQCHVTTPYFCLKAGRKALASDVKYTYNLLLTGLGISLINIFNYFQQFSLHTCAIFLRPHQRYSTWQLSSGLAVPNTFLHITHPPSVQPWHNSFISPLCIHTATFSYSLVSN